MATELEQLAARWNNVDRALQRLAAGRAPTSEGDEVGPKERALLEELERIEGLLGESRRARNG